MSRHAFPTRNWRCTPASASAQRGRMPDLAGTPMTRNWSNLELSGRADCVPRDQRRRQQRQPDLARPHRRARPEQRRRDDDQFLDAGDVSLDPVLKVDANVDLAFRTGIVGTQDAGFPSVVGHVGLEWAFGLTNPDDDVETRGHVRPAVSRRRSPGRQLPRPDPDGDSALHRPVPADHRHADGPDPGGERSRRDGGPAARDAARPDGSHLRQRPDPDPEHCCLHHLHQRSGRGRRVLPARRRRRRRIVRCQQGRRPQGAGSRRCRQARRERVPVGSRRRRRARPALPPVPPTR